MKSFKQIGVNENETYEFFFFFFIGKVKFV